MRQFAIVAVLILLVGLSFSVDWSTNWTQFQEYANHTGWDGVPYGTNGGLNQRHVYHETELSSPAVANGYVYLGWKYGSELVQLQASDINQTYTYFSTYPYGSYVYSPAVADGYVYAGTDQGYLFQLNASNVAQKIASFKDNSYSTYFESEPVVANGYVYAAEEYNGYGQGTLFKLNALNVAVEPRDWPRNLMWL